MSDNYVSAGCMKTVNTVTSCTDPNSLIHSHITELEGRHEIGISLSMYATKLAKKKKGSVTASTQ